MAFKIGDYVFHIHCGISLVKAIETMPGDESGRLFYVLAPLYGDDRNNVIRTPVDALCLKTPLSKAEALDVVSHWPDLTQDLYIKDSKARKAAYEAGLKRGDLRELAPLLEGAFQRKARDGHLNSMDAQFVNRATPLIYGELALALDIPYEDVPDYLLIHA